MPATRSALKRQRQEDYNGQQCVNKLPSEILSQIFVLCNHAWDPDVEEEEFPFQVRIPTVCRQWRKVALDTPALWSRITLSEPADYARVALFMSRSGATAPLDIDIDMTELFWSNSEEATLEEFIQLAEKAFKFIVSHGGVAPRWQRFCFQTDLYHAQSIAMNFLRSSFMPSLQHLEILFSGPAELDEEDEDAYYDAVASHPKPLLHSALPRLHTVKLGRVPGPYLFGHPSHPQLVGLTRLELEFAETQPDLRDLHCMLVASSTTLAVLCLDSGSTNEVYSGSRFGAEDNRLKIHFPRLEALSLIYIACPEWELNVLQLLDAPNLTALRIKALYPQDRDEHYLQLLDLLAHVPSKNSRLYFPALTHLSCDVTSEPTEDLRVLLTAYPRISSLSLPGALRLTALLKKPLLAPDLSRLRVQAEVVPELRKLALARYKAGIPLKEVEIDHRLVQRDAGYLKKYASKVITNFIHGERLCVDPMSW